MMLVAGNLLANMQVHHDQECSEENKFTDWLNEQGITRADGRWLWDRRDLLPMEQHAWQSRKKDKDTSPTIVEDDFDGVLRATDMLNIWGTWTNSDRHYDQSVSVYSALVSPDKSLALIRALDTLEQHHYVIPSADHEQEIDKYGFQLKGWIEEGQMEGLDRFDRWAGGIRFPPPKPAHHIVRAMGIEPDSDYRFWKDQEKFIVMKSQVWGQFDEKKRHENNDPEQGRRLQADINFLKSMLKKLNCDMVIDVEIRFHRTCEIYSRSVKHDEGKIPQKNKFYILKADGQFCTI